MSEVLEGSSVDVTSAQRLFIALSEQLKVPLMQIARGAELNRINPRSSKAINSDIEVSAGAALRLIDSYLLGAQTELGQQSLGLEPVAVSSVLHESAEQLGPLAKQYSCEVLVSAKKRYSPVAMTNARGLQAVMTSLGAVFIEASQNLAKPKRKITLAAEATAGGIMTGVFSELEGLGNQTFKSASELYGKAKMPFGSLTTNSGAGVFVASSLLDSMTAQLRVIRHNNLQGLAAILPISQQLNLKIY